jgi:hypothetical protein
VISDTGPGSLLSCETLRLSHCLDDRFIDGGWVARRPRFTTQNHLLVLIYIRAWANLGPMVRLEASGTLNYIHYPIGTRTRDLAACSIAPQSYIIKLIQLIITNSNKNWYYTLNSNTNEIRFVRNCYTCTSPWLSIHFTSLPLHSLHCTSPWLSIHFTSLPLHSLHFHPSLTNLISLYFTSRNVTSRHFTSLHFAIHFIVCNHNITSPDVSLS